MTQQKADKTVSLRDIFSLVWRHKWIIILPVIASTAIAYGGSLFLTPKYKSSAIIWIDQPANLSRELREIIGAGQNTSYQGSQAQIRQMRALENELKSQTFLFQLIRDLKLDENEGLTRAAAAQQEQSPDLSIDQIKFELLVNQLRTQISLGIVGQNQFEISVESAKPILARDMVNRLAEILEKEKSKYELEKILDNQSFADLQLAKMEDDYQKALDSLNAAQLRLSQLSLPESISSKENRRQMVDDIDQTKLEKGDLEHEADEVNGILQNSGINHPRLKYSSYMTELRNKIDNQITTLVDLLERNSWSDQNVVNINIRLNDNVRALEREIGSEVDQQFAEYPTETRNYLKRHFILAESIEVLDSRITQLEQMQARIEDRVQRIPKLQSEIKELEMHVANARKYRDAFRSEETTVEIMSERVRERTVYRIIEPARIPLAPFWPDKRKIFALGIVLGIVMGGAIVVVKELTDSSFRSVEDIEETLGLPVLAAIPKIENIKLR